MRVRMENPVYRSLYEKMLSKTGLCLNADYFPGFLILQLVSFEFGFCDESGFMWKARQTLRARHILTAPHPRGDGMVNSFITATSVCIN